VKEGCWFQNKRWNLKKFARGMNFYWVSDEEAILRKSKQVLKVRGICGGSNAVGE